jgi:hypothetical protein
MPSPNHHVAVYAARPDEMSADEISSDRLAFSVEHLGRGGHVACRGSCGQLRLPIEMQANGQFCVWLRGARLERADGSSRQLKPDQRETASSQLRRWLDTTNREGWVIER